MRIYGSFGSWPLGCNTVQAGRAARPLTPRSQTPSWMKFKFNVALRPRRAYGVLGTGSPGRPPRLTHSSWAPRSSSSLTAVLHPQRPLGTGSPGRPPRLTHSSWALRSSSSLTAVLHPQRPLGTGSPGRPPRLTHSSWALRSSSSLTAVLHPQRPLGTGSPGRPLRLSHSSWALKIGLFVWGL